MRIAVIGAGITGLTAAYRLSQKGHKIYIFEKEKFLGGLTAGFKKSNWQWSVENFFHHLFTSDKIAQKLISNLGIANQLFYTQTKASIYFKRKIAKFDSPISVLIYPNLSLAEKIQTGVATGYLKLTGRWQGLEKTPAYMWLKKTYGQKVYQMLWEPLLKAKFGSEADKISMAWFWARIKKRSTKLGYLKGGFQILISELVKKIKENGGQIFLNNEISCLDDLNYFDRVIFTTPIAVFLKILGNRLPANYRKQMGELKMIGALNLVLTLKERFLADGTYWLNINDSNFPFVAVVEHSNFIDPKYYAGDHILYVGGYYPQNHRYFRMEKEEIFKEFLPYLQRINSKFDFSLFTIHYSLFTNLYAQPIVPINYSRIIPQMKTPIPNVYLADMQMVYPWDRGINYSIELGEKVADVVQKRNL